MNGLLFFPRIALSGIRNNRKLYFPFFLTSISVVAIFYILCFISFDESIADLDYVGSITQITFLGIYVLGFFSVIFLIYTNSFLSKRRKKEFGLYNVLGMSKKNIAVVLFFETLFIAAVSIVLGVIFGVLFSKLAQMLLLYMAKENAFVPFSINPLSLKYTLVLFALLFALLFIINVISISGTKTISLVHAEEAGEKEPKANWLFGILGVLILGFAYYLAMSVNSAISAILFFFIAVILVIVATYLIFIATSVLLCKVLKKNKGFFYKTRNFISVSSMTFRMKRNGAGLASICILSTMVLVMVSSTACLYFGVDRLIDTRYPNDIITEFRFDEPEMINEEIASEINEKLDEDVKESGLKVINKYAYNSVSLAGYFINDEFEYDPNGTNVSFGTVKNVVVNFMSLADYNRITGNNVILDKDEALFFRYKEKYSSDTLSVNEMTWKLITPEMAGVSDEFEQGEDTYSGIIEMMCLVVNDYEDTKNYVMNLFDGQEITAYYHYNIDVDGTDEEKIELSNRFSSTITNDLTASNCYMQNKAGKVKESIALYAALFFLGIILSAVFIFATVLIIYYKQITEGYEDQPRFEIMKKVGITDGDIRATIKTSMLTVFFFPLVLAVIHLCFALPMLKWLMGLLGLFDMRALMISAGVCVALYTVVYAIIYRLTSSSYYAIVNSKAGQ